MRKRFLTVMSFLLIVSVFIFSSCAGSDVRNSEALKHTRGMLDKILKGEIEAAYEHINGEFIAIADFRSAAGYMENFLGNSGDYEITQISWRRDIGKSYKGESYDTYSAVYTVETDESAFTMEVILVDGKDGICGIDFADTSFMTEREKELHGLDILLTIYSFACFVFTLVMFVHCCKTKYLRKVRLALLILVGGYVRFTLFSSGIKFSLMLTLLNASSGVDGDIVNNAVKVTVGVPIGAIIYFINRKKFKLKELPPPPPDYDPRATADGFSGNDWV